MEEQITEPLYIIGISIRGGNVHVPSLKNISILWNKFLAEEVIEQIPNKVDSSIYCVYPNYENDYSKAYTVILGCRVENLNTIPEGLMGGIYDDAYHIQFVMKENHLKKVVFNERTKMHGTTFQKIFSESGTFNTHTFSSSASTQFLSI